MFHPRPFFSFYLLPWMMIALTRASYTLPAPFIYLDVVSVFSLRWSVPQGSQTQIAKPNSLFPKTFYITYFKQWFHSFKLVFPARNLRVILNSSVFLKIHIYKVPLKSLKFVLSIPPTLLLHHILPFHSIHVLTIPFP